MLPLYLKLLLLGSRHQVAACTSTKFCRLWRRYTMLAVAMLHWRRIHAWRGSSSCWPRAAFLGSQSATFFPPKKRGAVKKMKPWHWRYVINYKRLPSLVQAPFSTGSCSGSMFNFVGSVWMFHDVKAANVDISHELTTWFGTLHGVNMAQNLQKVHGITNLWNWSHNPHCWGKNLSTNRRTNVTMLSQMSMQWKQSSRAAHYEERYQDGSCDRDGHAFQHIPWKRLMVPDGLFEGGLWNSFPLPNSCQKPWQFFLAMPPYSFAWHGAVCWILMFPAWVDVWYFSLPSTNNRKDNGNIDIAGTDAFQLFLGELLNPDHLSFCALSSEEVSSLFRFLAFKRGWCPQRSFFLRLSTSFERQKSS